MLMENERVHMKDRGLLYLSHPEPKAWPRKDLNNSKNEKTGSKISHYFFYCSLLFTMRVPSYYSASGSLGSGLMSAMLTTWQVTVSVTPLVDLIFITR